MNNLSLSEARTFAVHLEQVVAAPFCRRVEAFHLCAAVVVEAGLGELSAMVERTHRLVAARISEMRREKVFVAETLREHARRLHELALCVEDSTKLLVACWLGGIPRTGQVFLGLRNMCSVLEKEGVVPLTRWAGQVPDAAWTGRAETLIAHRIPMTLEVATDHAEYLGGAFDALQRLQHGIQAELKADVTTLAADKRCANRGARRVIPRLTAADKVL